MSAILKIVTVIGARPQFIKAATVSRCIRELANVREIIVHTGQHYDSNMSDVFFEEMSIPAPDYNLHIGSGNHGAQTGQMLSAIETVLLKEKPDWVLVYGDTNSTLAGALAASKLHIPIAHVESGLRSYNRQMPEEINRVLTDHLSSILFAPTETAVLNLSKEGINGSNVINSGDVMYDAALFYANRAEKTASVHSRLNLPREEYILATIHRAENTDSSSRLQSILKGLNEVSSKHPVVLPLHPRTKATISRLGLNETLGPNIHIIEPVGYLDMVMLEKCAELIITDSGGVQKEAFFHKVPCITLREETEWTELVQCGWNQLLPPAEVEMLATVADSAIGSKGTDAKPYGEGHAAEKIVQTLCGGTIF